MFLHFKFRTRMLEAKSCPHTDVHIFYAKNKEWFARIINSNSDILIEINLKKSRANFFQVYF